MLKERGVEVEEVRYLEDPPGRARLEEVLGWLGREPSGLIRRKEKLFTELGLKEATEEELLSAMAEHPRLIERPVVIVGEAAAVGRPPENVLALFGEE